MKKSNRTLKKIIHFISESFDFFILMLFIIMFGICLYSNYQSDLIYKKADPKQYALYKPDDESNLNFKNLIKKNPDTVGWLNVYGTKIDYPVMKSTDNDKYINTNPLGEFALSGSLFLDYRNSRDNMDFDTIIYGHHMEHQKMFGSLDSFKKQGYFNKHKYGTYYFNNRNYGVEYFAVLSLNAYDNAVYEPAITDISAKSNYLNYIKSNSLCYRECGITENDHLIVLSTCAMANTDERTILVGRITDSIHKNTYSKPASTDSDVKTPYISRVLLIIILMAILIVIVVLRKRKKEKRRDS
ncbi:MAG: class B sortase [Suipraeoptans sp.]